MGKASVRNISYKLIIFPLVSLTDEKSVCGLLDDDREAELSESESEEEDEEEEDEIPIVEKKRTKSAFLDDEAEVSEDDEVVEEDEEDDDEVKSEAQGADTVGDTEEGK